MGMGFILWVLSAQARGKSDDLCEDLGQVTWFWMKYPSPDSSFAGYDSYGVSD